MKLFLITTALEEAWRDDEPVLFLGEWCRLYSRKDKWSKIDFEILPYHWDDRSRLYGDYQYLKDFHEILLIDLTNQLNQIHKVKHDVRYWRILIGPWLGVFTQILFDRWSCIQAAISNYDLSGTIVLIGNEEVLIPNDMADFASRLIGNDWDHYIYSTILQQFTDVPCFKKEKQQSELIPNDTIPRNNWKDKIKRVILKFYNLSANKLTRDQDAFFLSTYMSYISELKINWRLRQVFQLRRSGPSVNVEADIRQRKWVVNGQNISKFESFARSIIPQQIPVLYLEGYNRLMKQVESLTWPKNPKVIFTSNSHNSDDVFKAWAADKVEQGAPLVIGQHGGHYGTGLWSFNEDHEIAISTSYLSWGWSESGQKKVKPVGQLKQKLPTVDLDSKRDGALMVTTTLPRKSYRMYSVVVSRQWLDYFEDNCTFVKELPESIQNSLTVRLHSQDRGWNQVERWKDRFPEIHLDKCRYRIKDMILKSKLVICTYNATTYLESFAMNVPTVVFWNPDQWEIRDSAVPFFENLKRVGVFHDTPESAANHVEAIWDDIDSWWSSNEVREAVDQFIKNYCYLPDDILDRVEGALQEAITTSRQPISQ